MPHDLFSSLDSFQALSVVASSLLVRDVAGKYRPAEVDEVLLAAQVRGSDLMSSPAVVKDFLRTRLGTMPHEVFSPVSETPSGVSRALRYALLALTLLIVFGYGVWVTMTVV